MFPNKKTSECTACSAWNEYLTNDGSWCYKVGDFVTNNVDETSLCTPQTVIVSQNGQNYRKICS
jgi:hypothetical protein